ncbi:ABC transporter [Corynebacterium sp. NML130628]|nr:ABC transporter [Corynebacterium sp. NML130628]
MRKAGSLVVALAVAAGAAGCAPRSSLGTLESPPTGTASTAHEAIPLPPGALLDGAGKQPSAKFVPHGLDWEGSLRPRETTQDEPGDPALERIRQRGRLVVGVEQSQYLLSYRDMVRGQLRGFEVELAQEIARDLLGDPEAVDFRFVDSASRAELLQKGRVDVVIRTMSITPERAAKVAFSTPYLKSQVRVLAPDDRGITSMDDLPERTVCVVDGTTLLHIVRTLAPQSPVLRTRSWSDCLMATQQFQADAIIADDAILAGMIAQDPHTDILPDALATQYYAVGIPLGNDSVVRQVNATIERIRADGTWRRMFQEWLSDSTTDPYPPPLMYREEPNEHE